MFSLIARLFLMTDTKLAGLLRMGKGIAADSSRHPATEKRPTK